MYKRILCMSLPLEETTNSCQPQSGFAEASIDSIAECVGLPFLENLSRAWNSPYPYPAISCAEHFVPVACLAMWPLVFLGCSPWQALNNQRHPPQYWGLFPESPMGRLFCVQSRSVFWSQFYWRYRVQNCFVFFRSPSTPLVVTEATLSHNKWNAYQSQYLTVFVVTGAQSQKVRRKVSWALLFVPFQELKVTEPKTQRDKAESFCLPGLASASIWRCLLCERRNTERVHLQTPHYIPEEEFREACFVGRWDLCLCNKKSGYVGLWRVLEFVFSSPISQLLFLCWLNSKTLLSPGRSSEVSGAKSPPDHML